MLLLGFRIEAASSAFGFLGFLGLLPIFTQTRFRVFPKEEYDERDIAFLQRSAFQGFATAIATLCPTTVLVFFLYWSPPDHVLSIPTHVFWMPVKCGVIMGVLAFAVMLLLYYYKGENVNKEVKL
jgi:hypothetical protein